MYSRVLVIGSGGAGKTQFALKLGGKLKLPVIHLDRHFWRAGWVETDKARWREKVKRLVLRRRWVMDGNYAGSFDLRIPAAGLIIYLDFPTWLCLWRVLKRVAYHHGQSRPDMHPGCPDKVDWEFLGWIWNFRRRDRGNIIKAVRRYRAGRKLVILRSPREAESYLNQV